MSSPANPASQRANRIDLSLGNLHTPRLVKTEARDCCAPAESRPVPDRLGPALDRAPAAAIGGRAPYPIADLQYDWLPEAAAHRRGPVILMLPGWRNDREAMRPLGSLLAGYYDTILLGLPGFGHAESPLHDGSWGTAEYADCVFEFLQQQGISDVIIVGHSYGARVGIQLAHKHPALVKSLILIGGAGLPPVGWKKTRRNLKRRFNRSLKAKPVALVLSAASKILPGRFVESCSRRYRATFVSKDFAAAGPLRTTLNQAVNEDLSPLAASIEHPTLLLYGSGDTETPPELGRRFHRLFRRSEFVEMEGKQHFPHVTTGAPLCAYYIIKFLSANLIVPAPAQPPANNRSVSSKAA